jgi:hypothetical protein
MLIFMKKRHPIGIGYENALIREFSKMVRGSINLPPLAMYHLEHWLGLLE